MAKCEDRGIDHNFVVDLGGVQTPLESTRVCKNCGTKETIIRATEVIYTPADKDILDKKIAPTLEAKPIEKP